MAALLGKAAALNAGQAQALGSAWDAAWHGERSPGPAAWHAAWRAAMSAGRDWDGARKRAWDLADTAPWPSGYPVRRAVSDTAHALLVRDLITETQFSALCQPWRQVIGEIP